MAMELKNRKLLIRSDCPVPIRPRHHNNRPTSFTEPVKSPPLVECVKSASSSTLPRPSNAVRIYVPFGGVSKNPAREKRVEKSPDMTTRVIDVQSKSTSPLPELVQVTSAESSRYSTLSSPESLVSTSPRKSTLVRMGTKISSDALIREKMRLQDVSFSERVVNGDPSGAYVVGNNTSISSDIIYIWYFSLLYWLDTSVKSEDESVVYDAHESLSQSLAERFNRLPLGPSSPPQQGVSVK